MAPSKTWVSFSKMTVHVALIELSDLVNEKRFFHLGPKKMEFIRQLTSDANFLAQLNIMDYSLLVSRA